MRVLDSGEAEWISAGTGVVTGSWLLSHNLVPQFVGVYSNLITGVVLMVVAFKLIGNKIGASFLAGLGFSIGLDGFIRLFMPQTASAPVSWNYI